MSQIPDGHGLQETYDRMLQLAGLFDRSGEQMRSRSRLGAEILQDEAVSDSAALSPSTWQEAEDAIREATSGKRGLLSGAIELDADALVVRATVLTYRWIEELQQAAYQTLGSIAGRAIGFLAPEVALGGAIVSAGLIETDALDRDGVARYLSELAESHPELMDHVSTGGGLLEGLQLRAMLTTSALAGDAGPSAARGGLRAIGADTFQADTAAALRDAAGTVPGASAPHQAGPVHADEAAAPASLEELMRRLADSDRITVTRLADDRLIAYLPGEHDLARTERVRLVGGEVGDYVEHAVAAVDAAVDGAPQARVMLVGAGAGGTAAALIAASTEPRPWVVEQVVTAGAPSASAPVLPERTRVLSLEDRSDPVALLGSLINAGSSNRVTVVFDGATGDPAQPPYVAGGRAADRAEHAELRDELGRLRSLGYLA